MPSPTKNTSFVLFDGFCNLCEGLTNFVLQRDRRGQFTFVALQSDQGKALLASVGLGNRDFDSVVLIEAGRALVKSDAALRILHLLGGAWGMLYWLRVFPRSLRDGVYDVIAKTRYRVFGKKQICDISNKARLG